MRQRVGNILFGLCFLIAGIGFLGNVLGWWSFQLFFPGWWTLFIIVPCLISVIKDGLNIANGLGLVIGTLFLLAAQGVINGRVIRQMILPIILITIGIAIIFQGSFSRRAAKAAAMNPDGVRDYTAIFGSQNGLVYKEDFSGANLTAVFGSAKLDMREAIITDDVVITSSAIFGGTELWVPQGYKVKVSSVPIFGGTSNKSLPTGGDADGPTIYVNSTTIFGGMEIK
ncbi:cell wall-active antibiotics response protein [Eubacteriales bacterium OttesenSCG-928-M02]|nr:cell wall-active antibiotics response protein [Eubacteriales bacterium OttesenSCG-928-M02]